MALKDYYSILGIQPGASDAEIKRAYRRLAVTFHPDKNPDPAAENLFKEINEAYDVIGDPKKKRAYDLISRNPDIPAARHHRDPAYHRKRAPGPRSKGERERMYEFMVTYLPYARAMTLVSALVAFLVILDFALPEKIVAERISRTSVSRTSIGRSNTAWWTITTADGRRFELDMYVRDHFPQGAEVNIRLSRLLNIPLTVEGSGHRESVRKSVYGNFIFAPVILIIAAAVAVAFRNDVEKGFNYGIVAFLSLMLATAIFLILHG